MLGGQLSAEHQLGGKQALGLVLRGVGAMDDIGDQLRPEGRVRLLQSM